MSIIKPGSKIFDIGANWGQSAERFLNAGAAHVLCLEPCWQNYLILRDHPDPRITPLHVAAWLRHEILKIYFAARDPGHSSLYPKKWDNLYKERWVESEEVSAVTLDSLINQFGLPECIKIDVEGSESEVLQGLTMKPSLLIYEFHLEFAEEAMGCLEYAFNLGYSLATYTTQDLDLETEPFLTFDEFRKRFIDEKPAWGQITLR